MEELDLTTGIFLVIFALIFLALFPGAADFIIQAIAPMPE